MADLKFPYSNNQVLISSGGVIVHSKDDTIMLFGKKGVGISTPHEFHIDAPAKTVINSNIIELGLRAKDDGYALLKSDIVLQQLDLFFSSIDRLASAAKAIAGASDDPGWDNLAAALDDVRGTAATANSILKTKARSEITFTK